VSAVSPEWLALREPADAAARAADLVEPLRLAVTRGDRGQVWRHSGDVARPATAPLRVHDLGAGTGSMARWLAPRLALPQHWTVYDRDRGLLSRALRQPPAAPQVTVSARVRDVTVITAADLTVGLVTVSALLDLLTRTEVERIVSACVDAGCVALFTLSVTGRVDLDPADPLDSRVGQAFDQHQRRRVHGRSLLGPDAVAATRDAFVRHGMNVTVSASPWRLGPDDAELIDAWLEGWVGAAVEQDPDLAPAAQRYLERRRAELAERHLRVTVHHADLLAVRS
jgi:hypothetical protein